MARQIDRNAADTNGVERVSRSRAVKSIIDVELNGRFKPTVFLRSDTRPENALQMKAGLQGTCMMGLFAKVVAENAVAVFDDDTCGCGGAAVAFGFGNAYTADEYSADMYTALFTKGLSVVADKKRYQHMMEHMSETDKAKFLDGERLFPTRERARRWISEEIPVYSSAKRYAIFKPLSQTHEDETPLSVIFTVNPVELSALIALTASIADTPCLSVTPQGAGCQMLANYVQQQAESEHPRGVIGLLDLAARPYIRPLIPDDYLTYSVPWKMFLTLEETARDGVFKASIWRDAISGKVF